MESILMDAANLVNDYHDLILSSVRQVGLKPTDAQLHFFFMGVLSMAIFFISDAVIKLLAKWNLTAVSFIYTLIFMIVLNIAIEIEQKITGRGGMELSDVASGIWGFLSMFALYWVIRIGAQKLLNKR